MTSRMKSSHTKEEIDTIRKYAQLALADNPFDLRQMSFLVHVLKEKRKDMSAKIWEYRLEHLLGAIKKHRHRRKHGQGMVCNISDA